MKTVIYYFTGTGNTLAVAHDLDLLEAARQVVVDADIDQALGIALLDAGHFATELPMVAGLADALRRALANKKFETDVVAYQGEREPFSFW